MLSGSEIYSYNITVKLYKVVGLQTSRMRDNTCWRIFSDWEVNLHWIYPFSFRRFHLHCTSWFRLITWDNTWPSLSAVSTNRSTIPCSWNSPRPNNDHLNLNFLHYLIIFNLDWMSEFSLTHYIFRIFHRSSLK